MSNSKEKILSVLALIATIAVSWFIYELIQENEKTNIKARAFDIMMEDNSIDPVNALMQAENEFLQVKWDRQDSY